jgi:hypothetical protein
MFSLRALTGRNVFSESELPVFEFILITIIKLIVMI